MTVFGVANRLQDFSQHPGTAPTTLRAWCLANYDGDTITVRAEIADMLTRTCDVRVRHINTPELHTGRKALRAKGAEAASFTRARVLTPDGQPVAIMLTEVAADPDDKYGRLLATVLYYAADATWHNLADELLAAGLAVPYEGVTP